MRAKPKESVSSKWVTTDAEERALRVERARSEPMRVNALSKNKAERFQEYEVWCTDGGDGIRYRVELRSRKEPINSCTCPDFRKSFLGTCKHIERVLLSLPKVKQLSDVVSPCAELFMMREPYQPVLVIGSALSGKTAHLLTQHVDMQGCLRRATASALEDLIRVCEELGEKQPGVIRISQEVREYLATIKVKEELGRMRDSFRQTFEKTDGALPFLRHPLYPYQVEGVLHLAFKGRAMLADEMGLGKTVQAVAAAAVMREVMEVKRVLVVAPASLKAEWEDQIRFFTGLPFEILFGARHERMERYRQTQTFFLIANYEQVVRDFQEINTLYKPDLVILDEAQRIKNWRTQTAQRLKRLEARFAFVLTGTPLENRVDEVYSITEFIAPTLFGSLFRFNRRFYRFDEKGRMEGLQNLAELHESLKSIMLRRRKSDVEEQLPERVDNTYFVEMTAEQATRYAEYESIVARLYNLAKQRPLRPEEMQRMQLALSCMRIHCDSCYIMDDAIEDAPKLDELEKILEDLWEDDPTRKIIIFSEWVRMLELLEKRLRRKKILFARHVGSIPQQMRRLEIKKFKEDVACRLFLSSESGGVGLNLQVASVVVNLDLPWNPAKLEQRIARAWRKHQKNKVNVINLVSQGTLEQKMLGTLKFKQGLADAVLDARGDLDSFEQENARGAFMARLAEVMDTTLHVPMDKASKGSPELPPSERMGALLATENPGVGKCLARYDQETGRVQGVLAIGCSEAARVLREQVERTHGVSLPQDRVVVISPETQVLLRNLAELGFISMHDEGAKVLFDTGMDEPPRPSDYAQRIERAQAVLDTSKRQLRMASVLVAGGFNREAEKAATEAIQQASAALALFCEGVDVACDLALLTEEMVALLKANIEVDRKQVAVVQAVHLGLETTAEKRLEEAQDFVRYGEDFLGRKKLRG